MVVIEVTVRDKGTEAFATCDSCNVVVMLPSEIESITREPIISVVSTKALTLDEASLRTIGAGRSY